MQKVKQFENYFTKLCCVHLSEPIPLCRPKKGAEARGSIAIRVVDGKAVPVDAQGFPVQQPQPVQTLPIEVDRESNDQDRMVFSLVIENCVVVPSPSLERIILGYESGDMLMEVSVNPDDIRSITVVAGSTKPTDKRIIS
jgi:hypothetical protein